MVVMNCFHNELGGRFCPQQPHTGAVPFKSATKGTRGDLAALVAGIKSPEAAGQTHPSAAPALGKVPQCSCVLEVMAITWV